MVFGSGILASFRRVFYGKNNENAKLVQKIDFLILTYACLTQFINILDRSNFSNAYLSGMKKDLGFHGKQYNYCNTLFLVGYTIGQIPSNIALTYISPRIWFTAMQFGWAIICLVHYAAKNPQTVMGLRFVMGLFESSTFVGIHLILGSWYTPQEIGKRAALFTSCAQIGSILSGFIQVGLYEHMDGRAGLKGWQWLYIVDFLITLPVIAYGWFFFPDFPHNTKCRFMNAEEKALIVTRIPNQRVHKINWDLSTVKRILSSWQIYCFPLLFTLYGTGLQMTGNNTMPFFMEQHGITDVVKLNYYPTGMTGAGILAMWVYAFLSDWLKTKVPASVAIGATFIIAGSLCLSPAVSFGGKLFAFYLAGTTLAPQSLWYSWANDLTRHDFELRAVVTGSMNTIMEAFIAWWPLVFFASDADNFKKGFTATIILGALVIVTVAGIWFLDRKTRDNRIITIEASVIEDQEFELEQEEKKAEYINAAEVNATSFEVPARL